MRVLRQGLGGLAAIIAGTGGALAVDVNFTGNLTTACTLAVPLTGQLGLAADGSLSSEAGRTANLTVVSIGANQMIVEAPVWSSSPPGGYVASGEQLMVKYSSLSGFSFTTQAYTDTQSSITLGSIPLTTVAIDAMASNPNGFVSGSYAMAVSVTCAP